MKTFRRSLSLILVLALCLSLMSVSVLAATPGMANFTDKKSYTEGHFTDISGKWFEGSVARGYSLGLIDGKGEGIFDYKGNVTLAEAIKLAACMHSIYYSGEANFTQGTPWFQVYVDYCLTKGILSSGYPDYKAAATRAQFAQIFANALPAAALPAINDIADGAIPDVKTGDSFGPAVYKLYRAGILTGSDDKGTFKPSSNIQRSEMATIVTRMADPDLRKELSLGSGQSGSGALSAEQIAAKCSSAVFYIEICDKYGYAIATGSGVFISSDGKALTNHHVIADAHSASIQTTDGKVYDVSGWYDAEESIDLALIQVEGSGFDYLEIGDVSSLAAGQTVFAIGSPLGLDNTISQGIISNPDRPVDGLRYIQTSAPISHGSSGGALINDRGQLIGITSAMFADGQNLNLAVPISRAAELDGSTLHSFPIYGESSGSGYGANISYESYVSLAPGESYPLLINVDYGSYGGDFYMQYEIGDYSVLDAEWSEWYDYDIYLYLDALSAGSTEVTLRLLASDTDELLASGTVYVDVSDKDYYIGYQPTPDFSAATGVPLYYHEDDCYFYRYIDMASMESTLARYEAALMAAGFDYWKETIDSYGDPIIYYTYDELDLYVYIAINYIDGYSCLEVCPYYGWEV